MTDSPASIAARAFRWNASSVNGNLKAGKSAGSASGGGGEIDVDGSTISCVQEEEPAAADDDEVAASVRGRLLAGSSAGQSAWPSLTSISIARPIASDDVELYTGVVLSTSNSPPASL